MGSCRKWSLSQINDSVAGQWSLSQSMVSVGLPLDCLADVLNGLAHLPFRTPERVLRPPGCFVRNTLVVKRCVVGEIAHRLFELSLGCFCFSFEFIPIHPAFLR
jgi:hypothetical protein